MLQRTGWGATRRGRAATKVGRKARPGIDPLEGRALMAASLAPIASITAPAGLGYQVPLDGSGSGSTSQTFTVTSSNPAIKAAVAQGPYLVLNINHTASSQPGDQSFSGTLVFQLFSDVAPTTVTQIENLANSGFYNGKSFFRIADLVGGGQGYIAQAGAVNVSNTGGGTDQPPAPGQPGGLPATGFPFQNEFAQSVAFTNPGQLAMANAGFTQSDIAPGDYFTNTSQFFATQNATRFLDFGYTNFGQLVADPSGIYNKIFSVPVGGSGSIAPTEPISPVTITAAGISDVSPDADLHIDTTGATAGQTSTVAVTAFDPTSNTTTSQAFTVTVGPTNPSPGPTEKPFLNVFPSVNTPIQTAQGQPAVFQVQGISAGSPNDALTYTVAGSTQSGTTPTGSTLSFVPIPTSQGTATVNANGLVTVTPAAGYTGPITVLVGVRDQTDRTGKGLNDVSNYDVKQFTVDVTGTTPVSRAPIAQPVTATASPGTGTTIQLLGLSATTDTSAGLTYAIATQPTHGTLSNLNPATGTVTYTPTAGYNGSDTFTYTTTDTSNGLTSPPGTVTISVSPQTGVTGAVRLINALQNPTNSGASYNVLVITPPPNPTRHRDVIAVFETTPAGSTTGPVIQVMVNGVIDTTQPLASNVDQIVLYGSKTGTTAVIAPNVEVPVNTLDTGHGGRNSINYAGSGDTTINSWFGYSVVQGGSGVNQIVGRAGRVHPVKSPGTDLVFFSQVDPYRRNPTWKVAGYHLQSRPLGAFYRFVGKRLVKTDLPVNTVLRQNQATTTSGTGTGTTTG